MLTDPKIFFPNCYQEKETDMATITNRKKISQAKNDNRLESNENTKNLETTPRMSRLCTLF